MRKDFLGKILITLYFLITIIGINCTELPEPNLDLSNRISFVIQDAQSITFSAATISGSITCAVDNLVGKERGICVSTVSTLPTINDTKYVLGTGVGTFSTRISNLTPVRKYYFRPYVILSSSNDVIYGDVKNFTTLAAPATISTTAVSNITYTTATSGGTITADGGASITERGVCWSTSSGPTTSNSRTINGTGIGSFTSTLTPLNPGTTYFVRSYAVNSSVTTYGNEISFTTPAFSLPTISTAAVSSITTTSAVSGGNITNDGGAAITQRGVCWSTTINPTIANSRTINGSGVGAFSSTITGLLGGTVYYVRAYATNSVGTAYGPQISFSSGAVLPTVLSGSISSIANRSVSFTGGGISSDGGASIIDRGVCWSTVPNPTTLNSRVSIAIGTTAYTTPITGLAPNTIYYARAYATNSVGTSYSAQVSFATACILEPPTPSLPANASALPCCFIDFSWSQVCGATGYDIQISKSATFATALVTVGICGGSSVPSPTATNQASTPVATFCMNSGSSANNGVWYWRVRSKNATTVSAWSTTNSYSFTW